MNSLHNKVVVITGAGSGIGRSLALQCAALGAKLALCDINSDDLKATALEASSFGIKLISACLDISQQDAVFCFAGKVLNELGPADVLVNNAGVALSTKVRSMDRLDFEWLFGINFWGVVNGCSAFLPQLEDRPEAQLINISSVFGLIAIPGQAAYCASKFALRGYTDALRMELRSSKVAVTLVHPGGVRTNIVRHGRHYADASDQVLEHEKFVSSFDRLAMTTADQAAAKIIQAIYHRKSRVLIGPDAFLLDILSRYVPRTLSILTHYLTNIFKKPTKPLQNLSEIHEINKPEPTLELKAGVTQN